MTDMIPQDQELVNFWSAVAEAEAAGRSGGMIAEIDIEFGWNIFVTKDSGIDKEEAFFPYQLGSKQAIADAKALANKFVVERGLDKSPSNVFMIRIFKDTVLNKDTANWKGDRWQFVFPSEASYTKIVNGLRELGIKRVGKMWARLNWAEDTNPKKGKLVAETDELGNTLLDESGNPRMKTQYPLYAYVVEVYADKEEAMKAAGIEEGAEPAKAKTAGEFPEGYDAASFAVVSAEIKKEAANGTPLPKLAEVYGMELVWITKAINS